MKNLNSLVKIYDSGDKYLDRYTAIYLKHEKEFDGSYDARGMSTHPFSPQGFGCSTSAKLGRHLGKRIAFKDLPFDCQRLVLQDLNLEDPDKDLRDLTPLIRGAK